MVQTATSCQMWMLIPANSRGPSIVSTKIFDKTATLTQCKLQKQPSRNANGM